MPVCLIFHLDCTLLVSVEMESIYFVHLSSDAIEVKILPCRAGVYSPLCDTLDPYKCVCFHPLPVVLQVLPLP